MKDYSKDIDWEDAKGKTPKSDEVFEKCLNELRKSYEKDPINTIKETKYTIRILKIKGGILANVDLEKIWLAIIFIMTALVGIFNIDTYGAYLFGFNFYIAGILIAMNVGRTGLIFLMSHGVSGICVMEGALLWNLFTNPIIKDLQFKYAIYLIWVVLLIVVGVMYAVLYNLSDNLKLKRNSTLVPFIVFFIAFYLSAILPRIIGVS